MLPGLLTRRERAGRAFSGGVRTDRSLPIRGGRFQPAQLSGAAQITQIWRARVRRRSGSSSRLLGRQAPGQGPWPGEPTSGSYSFRRTMRLGTMGGSLR